VPVNSLGIFYFNPFLKQSQPKNHPKIAFLCARGGHLFFYFCPTNSWLIAAAKLSISFCIRAMVA
jgi:hypothetical protein